LLTPPPLPPPLLLVVLEGELRLVVAFPPTHPARESRRGSMVEMKERETKEDDKKEIFGSLIFFVC